MEFLTSFSGNQVLGQLDKMRGGYFYLRIESDIINQFERKRHTRLVCHLDEKVSFSCGLNHLGDGNFFLIIAGKLLDQLGKKPGNTVDFRIEEDPNPLGVEVPEVLSTLLMQDEDLQAIYEKISDGKKRALIFALLKIKDIDKQVEKSIDFLTQEKHQLLQKGKW
jgi:hypothetical protein